MGLLNILEQLDVYPKPFVDQFLNVDILFLRKFAHKVIHIWLEVNWKTKHSVGMIKLATCALREIVFCLHKRKSSALPELHRLLARLGVEELGQVLAEEELYHSGGAVAMLAHQDVGNVLFLGFRVI